MRNSDKFAEERDSRKEEVNMMRKTLATVIILVLYVLVLLLLLRKFSR
jgi:hypothetical protein